MKLTFPRATTLSQRFMLGVIPVALAGILMLGTSAYYFTKIYITKSVEREIVVLSQSASASIASFFKQRENDLETLSETSLLQDYYNNADYGLTEEAEQYRRELELYFLRFSKRTGVYEKITYVNAQGKEVAGVEDGKVMEPHSVHPDNEIFKKTALLRVPAIFRSPITARPGHDPVISYSKPIADASGKLRGILILQADLNSLQENLDRLYVGANGGIYISDLMNRPVLAGKNSAFKKYAVSEDMKYRLPITGTELSVVIEAPMSDFDAPLGAIRRFTILIALCSAGLVALFVSFRIRAMTRPVQKLVEATDNLANGLLSPSVEIESDDELGVLAASFNTMAGQLMDRSRELESRIRELLILQGMSASVIEKLDEEHISRICLEAAVTGIGFERGTLYLINKEGTGIVGRYVHSTQEVGFGDEHIQKRSIPLDSGDILAEVVRSKKAALIEDPANDPRVNKRFVEEVATRSFCLVPVMTEHKVLGIIGADNYYSGRKITQNQVNKLELFCNFTALALDNANLMASVKMSEERYRTVLDNSLDAIVGLDASFRITVWNRGAQMLFGYFPAEIMGQPVSKLFAPEAFRTVLRAVQEKSFFSERCVSGLNSLGRELEMDVTWTGSVDAKNREREWTVVIRDVSEQRKLQAQLIQAEKLSAVGQLISGVAHELNNPLTVIMGNSELLNKQRQKAGEEPDLALTEIYESSRRCGDIVKNLLAFVRESRKKKQVVSVSDVVKSAINLMSYKFRKAENISLTQAPVSYIPPVMADFHQIEQILLNLFQNASDALSEKEGEKKIEVRMRYHVNSVFIDVEDNGPGIPPELQSRIFDPFFTTKAEGQGTGLGLTICRRIAGEHGARLTCSSVPGKGSVFTLEIPIVNMPVEEAAPEMAPAGPAAGKKILVVDDEKDILMMIGRMLEAEGEVVHTASSAPEAIAKLKDAIYDAVICDVEMGAVKGFAVRQAMLEMKSGAGFIFTTGDQLNKSIMEQIKKANVPFLPKPFTITELLAVLKEALPVKPA